MSFQPRRRNVIDPRSQKGVVDSGMAKEALPRTKTRVVRVIRRREIRQPAGFQDVPETPTGALEVFSADEFALDAGILGRNLRRKFFR